MRRHDGRAGQTAAGPTPMPSPTASASPRQAPPGERKGIAEVDVQSGPQAVTELPIGAGTRSVRLLVPVEPAPSYDVVVVDAGGRAAWRTQGLTLKARGEPLAVSVPAEVFAEDNYVLTVQGEALRSTARAAVVRRLRVVRGGP
jgi:hypothetical protein